MKQYEFSEVTLINYDEFILSVGWNLYVNQIYLVKTAEFTMQNGLRNQPHFLFAFLVLQNSHTDSNKF
jgi:hypothetical protein